jgi:hypothetical protein
MPDTSKTQKKLTSVRSPRRISPMPVVVLDKLREMKLTLGSVRLLKL